MSRGHALVGLLLVIGSTAAQYSSNARLYAATGCTGESVILRGFIRDLSQIGFDNRAYSVRLRGPWMFFDLRDYNLGAQAPAEYAYESSEQCVNLFNGGIVTSVKHAGHLNNYRQDSITFYESTYFEASTEFVNFDIPYLARLNNLISSLIVTGTSSWTVYTQPNYSGIAICLEILPSSNVDPAFVADTALLDPSIPHGTISSVRKGCDSDEVVKIGGNNTSIHQNKVQRNPSFNF